MIPKKFLSNLRNHVIINITEKLKYHNFNKFFVLQFSSENDYCLNFLRLIASILDVNRPYYCNHAHAFNFHALS